MQRMLIRNSDGAVDLMGKGGDDPSRLSGPDLGHGDIEADIPAAVDGVARGPHGGFGGCYLACKDGKGMLDRLELSDGAPKLDPLVGVSERLPEHRFGGSDHRHRTAKGSKRRRRLGQTPRIEVCKRSTPAAVEVHLVPWLPCNLGPRRDPDRFLSALDHPENGPLANRSGNDQLSRRTRPRPVPRDIWSSPD